MTWTDASGRTLGDYPRPSVAVDVALLTVVWEGRRGRLCVLLHRRDEEYAEGRWSLPGTFVRERELLADAALRALADKAGVTGESPRQLRVFDDPDRDDRGRVLSVAHVDLVPVERLQVHDRCALAPVEGRPGRAVVPDGSAGLAFDHDLIVDEAARWARRSYRRYVDPARLVGEEFTLRQLQRAHEAVLGPLPKDAFRRSVEPRLVETGRLSSGSVGKPARVFRRR